MRNEGGTNLKDITIIGLGAMGGAIARVLLQKDYQVTVWNRSGDKADPLVKEGAILAPSPAAAICASTVSIICVSNYQSSYEILDTEEVRSAMPGRILIQLSTGSPGQACEYEAWARRHGADCLDGAIAASPIQMGQPEATIFTSGSLTAFQQSEPILRALAGNAPYYGEKVSAAASIDLAFLSYLFSSYLGLVHAARILEADDLRVDDFGTMIAHISPMIGQVLKYQSEVIQNGDYEHPQSSLHMSMTTVELLMEQAREANMNNELPVFFQSLFQRGLDAGYGEEEVAALIKIMR